MAPHRIDLYDEISLWGWDGQRFISELRATECLIYFGRPIHEFTDGLEALYAELFTMEAALIAALPRSGDWVAQWRETITDEDRNDAYKLMALLVQVDG